MAVEDLRKAKQKGDEQKVEKAEEKVEKAKEKVEKAEEKVEKAKEEVKEAKEEVKEAEEKVEEKAQQEKAIRCTASVLSQFSRKMHKKMKATSHIFTFYGSNSVLFLQ